MKRMPRGVIAFTSFATVGPPTGSKTTRAPLPPVSPRTPWTRSCSSVAITWAAPASRRACRFEPPRVRAMGIAPPRLGDVDRRRAAAARRGGDPARLARLQPRDLDQRAVGGQVLHPDRRRLLPGEGGGVVRHGVSRDVHQVAIDPVLVQAEGRDG